MRYSRRLLLSALLFVQTAYTSPSWQIDGANEGWENTYLVLQYYHHSEMQRQWAWHLLGRHLFKGDEKVMDFGCGDGKITAEISHCLPYGRIVGIDSSPLMITFSKRSFPKEYFPNLTFEQNENIEVSADKYDVICSFSVFHLVPEPIQILKTLRSHLAKDGKLLLVVPCGNNPAFFRAATETFEKYELPLPWSSSGKPSTSVTMRTKEGCLHCLSEAGFDPISIEAYHNPAVYFNKQELMHWMLGTVTANWQIPLEKAGFFFSDLIDRMVELDTSVIDASGSYHMKLSRMEVIAKQKIEE